MEVFHEDILETFLFSFLASLGIIQVMAARRGWHGLSVYGGRLHRGVNNALGAALLVFSYAWYFSDPLHRNVRNIEAFMSLVCLLLGILAACAATAVLASLSESLRRRLRARAGAGERDRGDAGVRPRELVLPAAKVLLSPGWEKMERKAVVFAEAGRGGERLARRLLPHLERHAGCVSVHPRRQGGTGETRGPGSGPSLPEILRELGERGVAVPPGADFIGLGWSGNGLLRERDRIEETYLPRRLLAVAPVVPDPGRAILGDSFRSVTPWDALCRLAGERPWREESFRALLRLWAPLCLACIAAAVTLTTLFHVRWSVLSGITGGSIASLWAAYFPAARRGIVAGGRGWEERVVPGLFWEHLRGGGCPLEVVVCGDDARLFRARLPSCGPTPEAREGLRFHVLPASLRGKFFLDREGVRRLLELLAE